MTGPTVRRRPPTLLPTRGDDEESTDSEVWIEASIRSHGDGSESIGDGSEPSGNESDVELLPEDSASQVGRDPSLHETVQTGAIAPADSIVSTGLNRSTSSDGSSVLPTLHPQGRQIYCPRDEAGRRISSRVLLRAATSPRPRLTLYRDPETRIMHVLAAACHQKFPDSLRLLEVNLKWKHHSLFRWVHIKRPLMDYNEFKKRVERHLEGMVVCQQLASHLLSRVEMSKIGRFPYGKFIDPGTVMGAEEASISPVSGIFAALPYLDVGTDGERPRIDAFPSRGLLQTLYPFEATKDREQEQVTRHLKMTEAGVVRVPQLWALTLSSMPTDDILITYGTMPREELFGNSISSESIASSTPKTMLIRFTDQDGQSMMFETTAPKTFLEIEAAIFQRVGPNWSGSWSQDCDLYSKIAQADRAQAINSILTTDGGILVVSAISSLDDKVDSQGLPPRRPTIEVRCSYLAERTAHDPPRQVLEGSSVPPFFHWPSSSHRQRQPSQYLRFAARLRNSSETPNLDGIRADIQDLFTVRIDLDEQKSKQQVLDLLPSIVELANSQLPGREPSDGVSAVIQSRRVRIGRNLAQCVQSWSEIMDCFTDPTIQSNDPMVCRSWACWYDTLTIAKGWLEQTLPELSFECDGQWAAVDRKNHGLLVKTETASYLELHVNRVSLETLEEPSSMKPTNSLKECTSCKKRRFYQSPGRLIQHLSRKHFTPEADHFTQNSTRGDSDFLPWMNHEIRWTHEEMLRYLDILLVIAAGTLERISLDLVHIKHGVCTRDGTRHEKYRLHRTILDSFVQIMAFSTALNRAVVSIHERVGDVTNPRYMRPKGVAYIFLAVTRFGIGSLESIKTARHKLYGMVREVGCAQRQETAYGPNIVMGYIARQLYERPLIEELGASKLYSLALDRLRFQVNNRPNKKLLRNLSRMREELHALSRVNRWQQNAARKCNMLCDDDTFYRSAPRRKSEYSHHTRLTDQTLKWLSLESRDLREMADSCRTLADQTKQSIEINEEDHGRLIFAFTFVTVIFLPLSFMTSYFGMNTVDIRDTTAEQDVFWAIALPVTLAVVAVTVTFAYREDTAYQLLMDMLWESRSEETLRGRMPVAERLKQFDREVRPESLQVPARDEVEVLEEAEFRARRQGEVSFKSLQGEISSTSPQGVEKVQARVNDPRLLHKKRQAPARWDVHKSVESEHTLRRADTFPKYDSEDWGEKSLGEAIADWMVNTNTQKSGFRRMSMLERGENSEQGERIEQEEALESIGPESYVSESVRRRFK